MTSLAPPPPPSSPHRAYRRLQQPSGFLATAVAGLVLYVAGTLALIPHLTRAHYRLTQTVLGDMLSTSIATRLGPWHLDALSLQVAYLPRPQLLIGALVSLVVLLVAMEAKRLPLWLRHVLGLFSSITLANTLFLVLFPAQYLSGDALSALYIRTQVLVWIVMPIVAWLAAVSVVLPRRYWLLLPLAWLALDFLFSIVRFAGWAVLLKAFGPIISPLLYFFTGPLLDALNLVMVFSVLLYSASSSLRNQEKKWSWL